MGATAVASALSVEAPKGSHFEFEEVKTEKGTKSLGFVPILAWDDLEKAAEFYGDSGILAILDGTSLRVSFQNIARRKRNAGKTDDEIAKEQLEFRPGTRKVGESTPTSRATRATRTAIESGVNADALAELVAAVASGKIKLEDLGINSPVQA
jgi:hypothetical protein